MELFGGAAESSKKLYMANLRRLSPGEIGDLSWLKDTKTVLAKIQGISNPNTRRSYYITAVSALKNQKGFARPFKVYHTAMMESNAILNKESYKSDHTKAKQAAISWQQLSRASPPDAQGKLIVALYTEIPPRRCLDYTKMRIGKPTNDTDNWYYNKTFIFNQYKTGKKYGQQIIAVPESIQILIPDQEWLLLFNGKPISNSTIMGRLIKKAFGADVGVSVLRNIYVTTKYNNAFRQLKEDATAMGTSSSVMENTYNKRD